MEGLSAPAKPASGTAVVPASDGGVAQILRKTRVVHAAAPGSAQSCCPCLRATESQCQGCPRPRAQRPRAPVLLLLSPWAGVAVLCQGQGLLIGYWCSCIVLIGRNRFGEEPPPCPDVFLSPSSWVRLAGGWTQSCDSMVEAFTWEGRWPAQPGQDCTRASWAHALSSLPCALSASVLCWQRSPATCLLGWR